MGSKTETKTEKIETRDPWAPAQPYIMDTLRGAKDLYNSDVGKSYFPGNTSIPMSWDTSYAIDAIRNRAVNGSPLNAAAQNQVINTINGDYFNPSNDFYNTAAGGITTGSEALYQPFMNSNTSPVSGYYADIAGGHNPYLDQTFENAAGKIRDAVNSNFSKAGRYGSAAHQGKLSDDLGRFATDLYGSAYQADQNRRLDAANAMQGAFDTDLARRMAATGSVAALRNQDLDRRFAAANGLNQNFQTERDRQIRAAMDAGALAANDYTDYDRLLQVGTLNEAQAARDLQADIDRFNFLEQNPANRLAQYANLSFGYGGLGGTNTMNSTQVANTSGLGNALGAVGGFASNLGGLFTGIGNLR